MKRSLARGKKIRMNEARPFLEKLFVVKEEVA